MKVLRVFPRRTSFTPTDALAFVGDPPLLRPAADEIRVSCTFTWDKTKAERLQQAWGQYYDKVLLGGPAYASPCDDFTPGLYVRPGVTFTSRGCNHQCPWCLVPEREGKLRLLDPIIPGNIIQDNNLLQAPRPHIEKVFAMLRGQRAIEFAGGLETDLVIDWIAEALAGLRVKQIFLACDSDGQVQALRQAVKRLHHFGRDKLRCYVLLGYRGESMERGLARLEAVWEAGAMPFAQCYQPPHLKQIEYSDEWRHLARFWSRPAAMKAMHAPK